MKTQFLILTSPDAEQITLMTMGDLRERVNRGEMSKTQLVWCPDNQEWKPASDILAQGGPSQSVDPDSGYLILPKEKLAFVPRRARRRRVPIPGAFRPHTHTSPLPTAPRTRVRGPMPIPAMTGRLTQSFAGSYGASSALRPAASPLKSSRDLDLSPKKSRRLDWGFIALASWVSLAAILLVVFAAVSLFVVSPRATRAAHSGPTPVKGISAGFPLLVTAYDLQITFPADRMSINPDDFGSLVARLASSTGENPVFGGRPYRAIHFYRGSQRLFSMSGDEWLGLGLNSGGREVIRQWASGLYDSSGRPLVRHGEDPGSAAGRITRLLCR